MSTSLQIGPDGSVHLRRMRNVDHSHSSNDAADDPVNWYVHKLRIDRSSDVPVQHRPESAPANRHPSSMAVAAASSNGFRLLLGFVACVVGLSSLLVAVVTAVQP